MYEQGAPPHGPKLLVHMLQHGHLTARRAAAIIGLYTIGITILSGAVARLIDSQDFHDFGAAYWWALQTVTHVGYGDIVPRDTPGRIVGGLLMVSGSAFLAVITASVTTVLIETARARTRTRTRDWNRRSPLGWPRSRLGSKS